MANGELITQVDELLQLDNISPKVATTLTLKLLKGIYETQQDHGGRLTALEQMGKVEEAKRDRLVDWTYVRDKLVQPIVLLLIGALISYLASGGG